MEEVYEGRATDYGTYSKRDPIILGGVGCGSSDPRTTVRLGSVLAWPSLSKPAALGKRCHFSVTLMQIQTTQYLLLQYLHIQHSYRYPRAYSMGGYLGSAVGQLGFNYWYAVRDSIV